MAANRHPLQHHFDADNPAFRAEKRVFEELVRVLPSDVHVFWQFGFVDPQEKKRKGRLQREREVDIIVLAPGTGMLVIEVKGGSIDLTSEGRVLSNGNEITNPLQQAKSAAYGLGRYACDQGIIEKGTTPPVGWLAICPDTPRPRSGILGSMALQLIFSEDLPLLGPLVLSALMELRGDGISNGLLHTGAIVTFSSMADARHVLPNENKSEGLDRRCKRSATPAPREQMPGRSENDNALPPGPSRNLVPAPRSGERSVAPYIEPMSPIISPRPIRYSSLRSISWMGFLFAIVAGSAAFWASPQREAIIAWAKHITGLERTIQLPDGVHWIKPEGKDHKPRPSH